MTPAQLKAFIEGQAPTNKLRDSATYASWTINDSDYRSSTTARYCNGANRYLYNPFVGASKYTITNT
jgi:hypothetical protein